MPRIELHRNLSPSDSYSLRVTKIEYPSDVQASVEIRANVEGQVYVFHTDISVAHPQRASSADINSLALQQLRRHLQVILSDLDAQVSR